MVKRSTDVKVWDLPLRLFHWTLVIAIALALLSSEEDSPLNQWHVLSGWVVAVLIAFRLVWGLVGGEHSRFSDFIRPSHIAGHVTGLLRGRIEPSLGHNPLGAIAVLVLLALAAVTVWTGAFGGEAFEEVHEIAGWTLLAMVAVHVLAVVIMSFLQRENLGRAMVTGTKSVERHPGAADAKPAGPFAIGLAIVVIAGAVYGIRQYDPAAFTLRSAEAFEHRGDADTGEATDEYAGEREQD